MNEHLRVRAGVEPMPGSLELRAQRVMVVDLAVEDDLHQTVLVADGLVARGEIDDAQAPDPRRRTGSLDHASGVGTPVRHRVEHRAHAGRVDRCSRGLDHAADAAHRRDAQAPRARASAVSKPSSIARSMYE